MLLKDVAESLFLAELLTKRRDVDGARRGIHSDRFMWSEAELGGSTDRMNCRRRRAHRIHFPLVENQTNQCGVA